MKLRDAGMTILIVVVLAAIVGTAASKITGKDDGPVEEFSESVIQAETGVNIDLSPGSPEGPNTAQVSEATVQTVKHYAEEGIEEIETLIHARQMQAPADSEAAQAAASAPQN